jgi:VWFA-related protein
MQLTIFVLVVCSFSAFAQLSSTPTSEPTPAPAARPAIDASPATGSQAFTAPGAAVAPQMRRVSILVSVTDRSGNPVRDLGKDQLSVMDNGQPGAILEVQSASDLPLDLAIVLLASKSNFAQQQAAAIDLAHRVLRPNVDQAFVVTAGGDKTRPNARLEWQTDPAAIEKAIRDLDSNTGLPDVFQFELSTDTVANSRMNIQHYSTGGYSVFNVIWTMFKADPKPARHAVTIFRSASAHSPGFSPDYEKVVESEHKRVIAEAQQTRASFYVIGVEDPKPVSLRLTQSYSTIHAGPGGATRVYDENLERARERAYNAGRANLERMADQTGGGVWWGSKKNYPDAVAGIVNALNAGYIVRYEVPASPAAVFEHLLQVKAKSTTARISGQSAYFSRQAPPPPSQAIPQSPPTTVAH